MSSTFGGSRFVQPTLTRTVVYPAKGGIVISVGDLLYYDTTDGYAKPLSAKVGSGVINTDQVFAHDNFIGVARSARIALQTTDGTVTVETDCIYQADCPSGTFVPGDLVTAFSSGAAAAGAIADQKIDTTALSSEAIGVVVASYSAATTVVRVRLYGKAARQVF
jgi:hypothetical protein